MSERKREREKKRRAREPTNLGLEGEEGGALGPADSHGSGEGLGIVDRHVCKASMLHPA